MLSNYLLHNKGIYLATLIIGQLFAMYLATMGFLRPWWPASLSYLIETIMYVVVSYA